MRLTFHGAAGEVTGSCFLLEVGGFRVLIDCGLVQGSPRDERRNAEPFPFAVESIDAVVLTHAHIDHSGRLPLLVKRGFTGPIYTQRASRDLCRIMLKDAASLNERDAEIASLKWARKGRPPVEPLYGIDDAVAALGQFVGLPYDTVQAIGPGVSIRIQDAGHILGSGIVEIWVDEGGASRKLVFSGDLGHPGAPILRDPTLVDDADLVVLESTYGDRRHRGWEETTREMAGILDIASREGGNILIPAFAVGRSQELLYLFGKHFREWGLGRWEIFLDSPMAIQATTVYMSHSGLYDAEAAARWRTRHAHALLPNLHLTQTPEQSMRINRFHSGAIIIAGSGMCTGGRIRHHLKHNVWRERCHVVIVGYQASGTLGRALVEGARTIRLWGEAIRVAARVHTVGGLSSHADCEGLRRWYGHFRDRPPVALVHGEPAARDRLGETLRGDGARVILPGPGASIDLAALEARTSARPLPAAAARQRRRR